MSKSKNITVDIAGFYYVHDIAVSIDQYFYDLKNECANMENTFTNIMEESKATVRDIIDRLIRELKQFHEDIQAQEEYIETICDSMDALQHDIENNNATHAWLSNLKQKIEGI